MKALLALPILAIIVTAEAKSSKRTTTTTTTTEATETTEDDIMESTVKALIDAGTCDDISSNDNCGDDAESYYHTFEYGDSRIVVTSGCPNHRAEWNQKGAISDVRCERWQYAILPLNPEMSAGGSTDLPMGTVGWTISGGVMFDERSSTDGSLAAINEVDALDPCNGHSNPALQYHYHLTPVCVDGANDTSVCLSLGYMDDGFPLYGECADYTSCYKQTDGTDGDNINDYYHDQDAYDAGECGLDECGGRTVNGSYGYYTNGVLPYIPNCRMGTKGSVCGFTP